MWLRYGPHGLLLARFRPAVRPAFAPSLNVRFIVVHSVFFMPDGSGMTTIHCGLEQECVEMTRKIKCFLVIRSGSVPEGRVEFVLASQRDATRIARHFSAGTRVGDNHSPVGTAEAFSVSAVPTGLRKTRVCPGTEVPGYYHAAPAGARTAFASCHAKVSRAFSSRTFQPNDRCR